MIKKNSKLLSYIGILLALLLIIFILLMCIRGGFTKYLEEKYSDLSFNVGIVKIDPIYGNFYARVTCLDDNTVFPISKDFKTKNINEDYQQYKNRNQYNSKIRSILRDSDIESSIKNITGGGKIPFENGGKFDRIHIYLIDNVDYLPVVRKVMNILKQNNVSAEAVVFTYEKAQHVYEISLSSDDYAMTESEIEAKVMKIK